MSGCTPAFSDVVTARGDGGVDIEIDHPQGSMRWELPGGRAAELENAIATARRGSTRSDASFAPPSALRLVYVASIGDAAHDVALFSAVFPDGESPYVRIREHHREPGAERWFAVSTLVHLAMNIGDPEIWEIGNRSDEGHQGESQG